jgi:hypothetical protein
MLIGLSVQSCLILCLFIYLYSPSIFIYFLSPQAPSCLFGYSVLCVFISLQKHILRFPTHDNAVVTSRLSTAAILARWGGCSFAAYFPYFEKKKKGGLCVHLAVCVSVRVNPSDCVCPDKFFVLYAVLVI